MIRCSRKLRHTIKFKFVVAFIVSIIIGYLLSFLIVSPYIDSKIEEVLFNRYETIISELQSSKNYEEKLDTLINLYDGLGYVLAIHKDIDELNLRKSQEKKIIEGEKLIYLVAHRPTAKVVGKINNTYISWN